MWVGGICNRKGERNTHSWICFYQHLTPRSVWTTFLLICWKKWIKIFNLIKKLQENVMHEWRNLVSMCCCCCNHNILIAKLLFINPVATTIGQTPFPLSTKETGYFTCKKRVQKGDAGSYSCGLLECQLAATELNACEGHWVFLQINGENHTNIMNIPPPKEVRQLDCAFLRLRWLQC